MTNRVRPIEFLSPCLVLLCLLTGARAAEPAPSSKAFRAESAAATEQPPAWFEWGGDLRARVIREIARKFDKGTRNDDRFWQRYRARVWGRLTFLEDLEFNVRLVTEPRYYCRRDLPHQFIRHEALFDRFNVKWANAFGLPLTITAGRQDIVLGDGWLVSEGTPLDGSRTMYFDALRLTYECREYDTVTDLIWVNDYANSSKWIRPFNDRDVDLIEQDERGVILYASNTSLANTRIDGYFIYKQDHNRRTSKGTEGEIYTIGAAVSGDIGEHWKYHVELAPQFGHKNGKQLCALASNDYVSYHVNDAWKNEARAGYEYLSGNDDPGKHYDRVWARHSRYSDLFNGAVDAIDGRELDGSNLHRPYLGWSVRPLKDVEIIADYSLLFADQNTQAGGTNGMSRHGCFRGQLLKLQLKHRINEHLEHRITTEYFFPGNFYTNDRNDVGMFLRYGITLTW